MIGKDSILKEGCQINGPVIIGQNCIIEKNCSIGPNTSIGDNSKISKADIKNTIVMSNCKIDYDGKIGDSIISNDSEISQQKDNDRFKRFLLGEGTKIKI